jgi:hypothetical protein
MVILNRMEISWSDAWVIHRLGYVSLLSSMYCKSCLDKKLDAWVFHRLGLYENLSSIERHSVCEIDRVACLPLIIDMINQL